MSVERPIERATKLIRSADVIALDWDGTLVDSVPYKIAQNQAIAREFGNELTVDEVRQIWNDSVGFPDLMKQLCRTDGMDEIMKIVMRDYEKPEYAKRPFEFAKTLSVRCVVSVSAPC